MYYQSLYFRLFSYTLLKGMRKEGQLRTDVFASKIVTFRCNGLMFIFPKKVSGNNIDIQ